MIAALNQLLTPAENPARLAASPENTGSASSFAEVAAEALGAAGRQIDREESPEDGSPRRTSDQETTAMALTAQDNGYAYCPLSAMPELLPQAEASGIDRQQTGSRENAGAGFAQSLAAYPGDPAPDQPLQQYAAFINPQAEGSQGQYSPAAGADAARLSAVEIPQAASSQAFAAAISAAVEAGQDIPAANNPETFHATKIDQPPSPGGNEPLIAKETQAPQVQSLASAVMLGEQTAAANKQRIGFCVNPADTGKYSAQQITNLTAASPQRGTEANGTQIAPAGKAAGNAAGTEPGAITATRQGPQDAIAQNAAAGYGQSREIPAQITPARAREQEISFSRQDQGHNSAEIAGGLAAAQPAAAATATAVAESAAPNQTAPAYSQVSEQMLDKLAAKSDSCFQMKLYPEGLGEIQITLSWRENQVTLDILTHNPATQQLLDSQANQLKAALIAHDYQVAGLNIHNNSADNAGLADGFYFSQNHADRGNNKEDGTNYQFDYAGDFPNSAETIPWDWRSQQFGRFSAWA